MPAVQSGASYVRSLANDAQVILNGEQRGSLSDRSRETHSLTENSFSYGKEQNYQVPLQLRRFPLIEQDSKTLVLARLWFLSSREERNPRRGAEPLYFLPSQKVRFADSSPFRGAEKDAQAPCLP